MLSGVLPHHSLPALVWPGLPALLRRAAVGTVPWFTGCATPQSSQFPLGGAASMGQALHANACLSFFLGGATARGKPG